LYVGFNYFLNSNSVSFTHHLALALSGTDNSLGFSFYNASGE